MYVVAGHASLNGEPIEDMTYYEYVPRGNYINYVPKSHVRLEKVSDNSVSITCHLTFEDQEIEIFAPKVHIDMSKDESHVEIDRYVDRATVTHNGNFHKNVDVSISAEFSHGLYGTRCSPAPYPVWNGEMRLECTWEGNTLVVENLGVRSESYDYSYDRNPLLLEVGIASIEAEFDGKILDNFRPNTGSLVSVEILRLSESQTIAHLRCSSMWGRWYNDDTYTWVLQGPYHMFDVNIPNIPVALDADPHSLAPFDFVAYEGRVMHSVEESVWTDYEDVVATVKGDLNELTLDCTWLDGSQTLKLKVKS